MATLNQKQIKLLLNNSNKKKTNQQSLSQLIELYIKNKFPQISSTTALLFVSKIGPQKKKESLIKHKPKTNGSFHTSKHSQFTTNMTPLSQRISLDIFNTFQSCD